MRSRQPLIQGGTLLVIITFLFVQNPIMGLAAVSLYPLQAYVIPKLQRRVNQLGKQRVRAVRKLSERIGEAIAGVQEMHGHGTSTWERADFSDRLGIIFKIRFEIYQRKSFVKFLNNLLNQMVPLLFYSIGGYLVIQGEPDGRRAGRGAGRAQGHVGAVEGAARLLPADPGLQDQVRAGHRAIQAGEHVRRGAAGAAAPSRRRAWKGRSSPPTCRWSRTANVKLLDERRVHDRAGREGRDRRRRRRRQGSDRHAAGAAFTSPAPAR